MHFSTVTAALVLASSAWALPAEEIFKRSPICLTNFAWCAQGDAKHIVDDLVGRGKAQERITVGTEWTSIAYYADCNAWAHAGSGSETQMAGDVAIAAQAVYNTCRAGNTVGGSNTVGGNFYLKISRSTPI